MRRRPKSFRGAVAQGFLRPGLPAPEDVLDLLDPEVARTLSAVPGWCLRIPALVAFAALIGGSVDDARRVTRTEWRRGGGRSIEIGSDDRGHLKRRRVPVLPLARSAIDRYVAASTPAPGCDALFVDQDGGPLTKDSAQGQMSSLAKRLGLPDGALQPGRLRRAFAAWIDGSDDREAVNELRAVLPKADMHRAAVGGVGPARLLAVLEGHHPLANPTRDMLRNSGARRLPPDARPDALPDEGHRQPFPKLTKKTLREIEAVRATGTAFYPDEFMRAAVAAEAAGYRARETAAHYGVKIGHVQKLLLRSQSTGTLPRRRMMPQAARLELIERMRAVPSTAAAHARWLAAAHGYVAEPSAVGAVARKNGIALRDGRPATVPESRREEFRAEIRRRPGAGPTELHKWLAERHIAMSLHWVCLQMLAARGIPPEVLSDAQAAILRRAVAAEPSLGARPAAAALKAASGSVPPIDAVREALARIKTGRDLRH